MGGLRERGLAGRVRDVALLHHGGDDLGGTIRGTGRVAVRRELRRRLHEPGQHRSLAQGDGFGAVAEIAVRRSLDPIGAGAEIDAVEVELEDLVLGVFVFEPDRQDGLLDLARHGAFLGQEQVLGELLGQGRAALHAAAADDVAQQRTGDPHGVDAVVDIEAPVLDGHEGLRQVGRKVLQRDGCPARVAAIGERRAVVGHDRDVRRPFRHGELVDRRQLARVIGDGAAGPERSPDAENEAPIDEASEETAATPAASSVAAVSAPCPPLPSRLTSMSPERRRPSSRDPKVGSMRRSSREALPDLDEPLTKPGRSSG